MYVDNILILYTFCANIILFTKHEKEPERLLPGIRISCQHIDMECGIEKCALLTIKSVK